MKVPAVFNYRFTFDQYHHGITMWCLHGVYFS